MVSGLPRKNAITILLSTNFNNQWLSDEVCKLSDLKQHVQVSKFNFSIILRTFQSLNDFVPREVQFSLFGVFRACFCRKLTHIVLQLVLMVTSL